MHATPRAVFRCSLLGLVIGLQTATADAMQQTTPDRGVSQTLAQARATLVTAVAYELDFALTTDGDLVRGHCVVRFALREGPPAEGLVIDFAGKQIHELRVNGSRIDEPRAVHDHIVVPAERLTRGENDIDVDFSSPVAATGTALTRYVDRTSGRQYLYTLLVPADAHGLFPCFDQPDLKAEFTLRIRAPAHWLVVGNAPRTDRRPADGGQTAWEFAPTDKISTYLFAFAAGDFEVVESSFPFRAGRPADQPMRMYLRPEERARVDATALFEMHAKSVDWLAAHFTQQYPFAKLDFVLLPGFPYGGMEHAGAIFYRDSAVSFDHEPTRGELVNRSALVYHEVSHQWFGNLVSFVWFDDLWLKEGFATFMGYRLIEALEPEQKAWVHFHRRVKPRAYEVDVTSGTTPVYQSLANLADAKSAYGAIVYNKAPAVLRELEARIGVDRFRAGISMFLRDFAWRNATWKDLVTALERAAERPLAAWSSAWILRAGLPRLQADWSVSADGKVAAFAIRQQGVATAEQTWPMRVQVMVAAGQVRRQFTVTLGGGRADVPELVGADPVDWVLLNPGDEAYAQFLLDPRSARALIQALPNEGDAMVRAVALSALRENVREGLLDPLALTDLALGLLANEREPEAHAWLLDVISQCVMRYATPDRARDARARSEQALLESLRGGNASLALQSYRTLARLASGDDALQFLAEAVAKRVLPGKVTLGTQDLFTGYGALLAAGRADDVRPRLPKDDDATKWSYVVGAASPAAAEKARYFSTYLDAKEPPEQWVQQSLGFFHWHGQAEVTLPYLRRALDRVEWVKANRKIFFMPAWVDGFVNGHSSPEALQVVEGFLVERRDLPADVQQKIRQSADELRRVVRIQSQWR